MNLDYLKVPVRMSREVRPLCVTNPKWVVTNPALVALGVSSSNVTVLCECGSSGGKLLFGEIDGS
jgi:hypothetical protein